MERPNRQALVQPAADTLHMQPGPQGEIGFGWGRSKRKLHTAAACRQEAARVYKLAAQGRIAPEDLGKAIFALGQIAKLAEMADLEKRLDELEALLAERKAQR